jgi:Class III cytochrome C family.
MKHLFTIAFIVSFGAAIALADQIPASVTVNEAANKQPGVTFAHAKHGTTLVKSCDTCHHKDKGLTKATAKNARKCSSCHLNAAAGVPGMREMSMQKNPFHMVCISCHKTEKKGPVSCKDCHVKK